MPIYKRDPYLPEWEPIPWQLSGAAADEQEREFHLRACKTIAWHQVRWDAFPDEGIFGQGRDWFVSNDITFYATCDGEDLLLIDNAWSGWPDPPRWGLASRPAGKSGEAWTIWGHFSDLPHNWEVPGGDSKRVIDI